MKKTDTTIPTKAPANTANIGRTYPSGIADIRYPRNKYILSQHLRYLENIESNTLN